MDIIELDIKDLNKLECINNKTYESEIYRIGNKVYKLFRGRNDILGPHYTKSDLENKERKIELLHEMDLSDSFLKPEELIYINNQFRGYTLRYGSNKTLERIYFKSREQRLYYLKKIKEIIDEAHEFGIILNDINTNNFLIDNLQVYICDLDNCMIGNLKPDISNFLASDYINIHGFDYNLDYFLFNIICIYMLSHKLSDTILDKNEMLKTRLLKNPEFREFYLNFININNPNYTCNDVLEFYEHQKKLHLA